MSLQFVIGSSGSGKSTYIYNRIIEESIKNPKKNYIIIVPEQFTMQTQRELVRLHPNHVIMNIDVLSFNRLAYRVFDELGTESLDVLEESGKNLVIRKLLTDKKDGLSALGLNSNKVGCISEIKSFISELSQYGISPTDFLDSLSAGGFNSHFRKKAEDIAVIYKAYEDFIKDRFVTAETILIRLNEVIADSKFLSESEFVFDGFTGFTPLQNELLMTILPIIDKAYVVVTMDESEPMYGDIKEYELFSMSKKMIKKTTDICETCNVDIDDEPIICDKNYRLKENGVLEFIEQHIFRMGEKEEYREDGSLDELTIHLLKNPSEEIEFVATEIAKDVRDNNMQYREITVCVSQIEKYKDYFDAVFTRYNIPYYLDVNNEVVFQPLIELIRSAFLIFETGFSYESVMQFLRCNLTDLTINEVDMMDNYLRITGIRGEGAYKNSFKYEPKEFENRLREINGIRDKFIEPLLSFNDSLKGENDGRSISTALYKLLCDYDVEDKINEKADRLEAEGRTVKSAEYSKIFKIIITLLDKIVLLLGDEVISPKDYLEIFISAAEGSKINTIPASNDAVVIGDLERTRYDNPKAMYLMGVNDGAIPASFHSAGIISQTERTALKKVLKDNGFDIAPTDREKSFMQRFYIYMILTKAREKLCLTYSAGDNDKKPLNKSYLIDELLRMFPDLTIDIVNDIGAKDSLVTFESSKRYVASSLRDFVHDDNELSPEEKEILFALIRYAGINNYRGYDSIISGAFYYHNKEEIDSKIYNELVNSDNPVGSVSRLELYRKCAYSYFLNYCLKIREKENRKLERLDLGNIYHDILESFSLILRKRGIKWRDVDLDTRRKVLDDACDSVFSDYKKLELLDAPREIFALRKVKTTMDKTVESLVDQAKHSSFEPYGFEVELSEIANREDLTVALRDGRSMTFQGRIDRLDTYEREGKVYVKIIDYKSGNNKIDFEEIYNGLQLQLIYYLDVAVKGLSENGTKEVKPAAMFYYHVKDPIVDYASDSIDDAIKKEMIPSGFFFDEEAECDDSKKDSDNKHFVLPKNLMLDIARALDLDCEDGDKSLYAPLAYTAKGKLNGQSTKCLGIHDIERMEAYVENKIKELGSDMYSGEIDSKPVKDIGCKYCPYGGVCGFDSKMPGYEYSDYKSLSGRKKEKFFELIDK